MCERLGLCTIPDKAISVQIGQIGRNKKRGKSAKTKKNTSNVLFPMNDLKGSVSNTEQWLICTDLKKIQENCKEQSPKSVPDLAY